MTARRNGLLPAALAVAVLLAACGGGGGDVVTTTGDSGGTPAPQTASLGVTVIDGAIQGAVVCLDKNLNGTCDAGEPTATTDANGKATLTIDPADQGKYPVLALIGTDAVDKDSGKVAVPFVMKAPGDQPGVVSPITTLVESTIESTGVDTKTAATTIQAQIGVSSSTVLFADYTQNPSGEQDRLHKLAQLVVATAQQQQQVSDSPQATGTPALDGKPVTADDIKLVVPQLVLGALAQLVTTLDDNPNTGVSTLATQLVGTDGLGGVNGTNIQSFVVTVRSHDASGAGEQPKAGATMATLNYTDADNWMRRVLTSSAAQNTPDSNGMTRFVDRRSRANTGVIANWGFSGDPTRQSDFHWDGQAWTQCTFNSESTSTVRDAQGRSKYNFCDGFEVGGTVRSTVEVGGRSMIDVYNQIQQAGYTNVTIQNAATVLGTSKFPGNSKLFLQVTTPISNAYSYIPNVGQEVRNTNADVAGGDQTACGKITPTTPLGSYTSLATTLESMIAVNQGTPCVFQPTTDSGQRNEWWSQSTLSVGQIGTAPTGGNPTSFYSGNTLLRVAFGPNNTTTYYSCQQRALNASARNCDKIGSGTYAITTLDDARALTLQNEPAQFQALGYRRVFVQRGGLVYFGYQNRPTAKSEARFNLDALNALATQLGLPTVDPDVPAALTAASYQGDWIVNDATNPLETISGTTIRISPTNASTVCIDNSNFQSFSCTLTLDPATGAITYASPDGNATGTFNFSVGSAGGTFTPTGGTGTPFHGERR